VLENIRFFAEVRGLKQNEWLPRSMEILEFVGLANFKDRRAGQLSGGMKQKLGLASALVGRRRSTDAAWLYALHPLGAVEAAGSGHLEPAAVLTVVLAVLAWDRRRSGLGWASLGALVKVLPALLFPTLWRRSPWLLLLASVVAALSALPFADAGLTAFSGLLAYTRHWSFNPGLFAVLRAGLGEAARPVAMALGAAVVAWAWWKRRDPAEVALWAGGAFVLLSPTVHPWYVAWVWVPALLCGVRAWTVLATLAPLSYLAWASYRPATGTWTEPTWTRWVIYLPFFTALAWEAIRHQLLPGPWSPRAEADPT